MERIRGIVSEYQTNREIVRLKFYRQGYEHARTQAVAEIDSSKLGDRDREAWRIFMEEISDTISKTPDMYGKFQRIP